MGVARSALLIGSVGKHPFTACVERVYPRDDFFLADVGGAESTGDHAADVGGRFEQGGVQPFARGSDGRNHAAGRPTVNDNVEVVGGGSGREGEAECGDDSSAWSGHKYSVASRRFCRSRHRVTAARRCSAQLGSPAMSCFMILQEKTEASGSGSPLAY